MAENFYHDTHRILGELLSKLTELGDKLDDILETEGLSDEDIEDGWEGDEE